MKSEIEDQFEEIKAVDMPISVDEINKIKTS
jgi:hypothetical protein